MNKTFKSFISKMFLVFIIALVTILGSCKREQQVSELEQKQKEIYLLAQESGYTE